MARDDRDVVPRSSFRFPSSWPGLWSEINRIWDEMNRLGSSRGGAVAESGTADISVSEDNDKVYVEAHLPGVQLEDLNISLDRNTLLIKGEKREEEVAEDKTFYQRARSSFSYRVDLPARVEEDTAQAQYQDGVLRVAFNKTEPTQVRKISVTGGNKKALR